MAVLMDMSGRAADGSFLDQATKLAAGMAEKAKGDDFYLYEDYLAVLQEEILKAGL
ncbi:MMPL family transporter, partial [Aduncisulcus paluster]